MVKIDSLSGSDYKVALRLANALRNMHEKSARYEEGYCSKQVVDNAEQRLCRASDAFDELQERVGAIDTSDIYDIH